MIVIYLSIYQSRMKKNSKDDIKESTVSAQIAFMKEFVDSPGWKLMEKECIKIISKIKENLRVPCTDQSLKFNVNNLLSERISAIYIMMNFPKMAIKDLENILSWQIENAKPLQQRLEEQNKKMSDELKKMVVKI